MNIDIRRVSEGSITGRDDLSALCAIMDKIFEDDIDIPIESIKRLVSEIGRQL